MMCREKLVLASGRMLTDLAHNESSDSAGDMLFVVDEERYADDWADASAVVTAIRDEAKARSGLNNLDDLRQATDSTLAAHKRAVILSDSLSNGIERLTTDQITKGLNDTQALLDYTNPAATIEANRAQGSLTSPEKLWYALNEFQKESDLRAAKIEIMISLRKKLETVLSSESSKYQLEHLIELDNRAIYSIGSGLAIVENTDTLYEESAYKAYVDWKKEYDKLVLIDASLLLLAREMSRPLHSQTSGPAGRRKVFLQSWLTLTNK